MEQRPPKFELDHLGLPVARFRVKRACVHCAFLFCAICIDNQRAVPGTCRRNASFGPLWLSRVAVAGGRYPTTSFKKQNYSDCLSAAKRRAILGHRLSSRRDFGSSEWVWHFSYPFFTTKSDPASESARARESSFLIVFLFPYLQIVFPYRYKVGAFGRVLCFAAPYQPHEGLMPNFYILIIWK